MRFRIHRYETASSVQACSKGNAYQSHNFDSYTLFMKVLWIKATSSTHRHRVYHASRFQVRRFGPTKGNQVENLEKDNFKMTDVCNLWIG